MEDFKPGDVVQVKSGGPSMTIASIEGGQALCQWFDKNTQKAGRFALETLEKYTPPGIYVGHF
jgi:uncharacterized protein YodC (DUF2158 family)